MAHIYQAPNPNREEVEEYLNKELNERLKREEKDAENRPLLLTLYFGLMALCVGGVLFILFWPGMLRQILDVIEDTLRLWGDQVGETYHILEEGDYSGDLGERLGRGIGEFFEIILRTIAGALLYFLAWVSPVLFVGGMLVLAFFIVRLLLEAISMVGFHRYTEDELRESILRSLPSRIKQLNAGLEGEEKALQAVSVLDDDCHIFANLVIEYEGERNETDLLVVSPTGLTMVEVKNYSGTLIGDLSDREITQRKTGKRGRITDEKRSNPVKQVGAPTYKLAHYLKDNGISVEVRRCALFIHPDVTFQLTDREGLAKTCPLYHINSNAILGYLSSSQTTLSEQQVDSIVAALKKFL